MEVEFVDELPGGDRVPPSPSAAEVRVAFASELRARPSKWAVYPQQPRAGYANVIASRINNGNMRAFSPGFEAAVRDKVIYIRYIGDRDA